METHQTYLMYVEAINHVDVTALLIRKSGSGVSSLVLLDLSGPLWTSGAQFVC